MMRRRFGFSRGSFKAPREPLVWFRQRVVAQSVNVTAAAQKISIFAPTAEFAGAQDESLTIRKLIIQYLMRVSWDSVTGGDVTNFAMGIGIVQSGATIPSPLLAASYDENFDWMYLANSSAISPSTGALVENITEPRWSPHNQPRTLEVKTNRKIRASDQLYILVHGGPTVQGAAPSATLSYIVNASILWQRTMRRR